MHRAVYVPGDYKILGAATPGALTEDVKQHLALKWQPSGGPFCDNGNVFYQAVSLGGYTNSVFEFPKTFEVFRGCLASCVCRYAYGDARLLEPPSDDCLRGTVEISDLSQDGWHALCKALCACIPLEPGRARCLWNIVPWSENPDPVVGAKYKVYARNE